MSELLNVLDGFHAPCNVVFGMTTNALGALDPALLRPGESTTSSISPRPPTRRIMRPTKRTEPDRLTGAISRLDK